MADKGLTDDTAQDEGVSSSNGEGEGKTLEQFIRDQYETQKDAGKMEDSEEIDAERRANFFSRALGESHRMNAEVVKSQEKQAQLHAELGADTFKQWRTEHASQVLSPQQISAIEKANEQPI